MVKAYLFQLQETGNSMIGIIDVSQYVRRPILSSQTVILDQLSNALPAHSSMLRNKQDLL